MKKYETAFKEESVRLAQEIGTRRAAEQLGLSYHTLSGWRSSKQKHGSGAFVGSGHAHRSTSEISPREQELQRENDELRRANEILKDALGFFAKDRRK